MKLVECFNCAESVPESDTVKAMGDFQTVFPHSILKQPVIVSKWISICNKCAKELGLEIPSETK